jgi:hypothetical protein
MILAIPITVGAEVGTDRVLLLDLESLEQAPISVTGDLAWQRLPPSGS